MTKRISVRNLEVGQFIKKGYSADDNLLLTDYEVNSDEELQRLRNIGLNYCLVPDPREEKKEEETVGDEEAPLEPEDVLDKELEQLPSRMGKTRKVYDEATDKLDLIFESVHQTDHFDAEQLHSLDPYLDHLISFMDDSPASVSILTQIESYDEETLNHSLNVSIFSMIYGRYRGLSHGDLMDLGFGALLHDIGKTKLSRKMVQKEDDLEAKEWEMVQKHPEKGRRLLRELGVGEIPQKIAYEHHERPDGSGYPKGTSSIHFFSRIVSVFDVYEALTSPRDYQDPVNPVEAYKELRTTFSEYPETRRILQGMIQALGFFPVGCLLRLSNGDLAVVYENHPDNLKKPIVKVIKRGDKRSIDEPYTVDLDHIQEQKELINNRMYNDAITISEVYGLSQAPALRETVASLFREQGFGEFNNEEY